MPDYKRGSAAGNQASKDYVSWFRASTPYINAHRGKLFVLMICGEAIAHEKFAGIIHDIALLNTLGIRLVIVYGSRPQINKRLAEKQHDSQFYNGSRITDQIALDSAIDAAGALRAKLEALLSMGLANSPMHLARIRATGGNFVVAKPMGVVDGIDFQSSGEVRRIDCDSIHHHLDSGHIVIIGPLGYSPTGEIFNLFMEEVAVKVATSLKADKLLAFNSRTGIYDNEGILRRELTLKEAQQVVESSQPNQQSPLLTALLRSISADIDRCHLISYQDDGALLKELFTRDGCGSLIYSNRYESIRPATINDVRGILDLIEPLEREGILVKRSRDLLETEIKHFTVIERDGMVVACAALYPYPDEHCGELACVVTNSDYRGAKRGERLLAEIEKRALDTGLSRLFVMTTRTGHWFREQGYTEGTQRDLPQEKQLLYNFQRNSKILSKKLVTTETSAG